ncbi:MAG: hypothetical protein ABIU05_15235, partial [Nitrospirales bacterium]
PSQFISRPRPFIAFAFSISNLQTVQARTLGHYWGDMKGETKEKMKAKHDDMKGEMKGMKDEMKGAMGK